MTRSLRILALAPMLGCVVYIRDPEHLEAEAVEIIEGQKDTLDACYDRHLLDTQIELEAEERAQQGPYADIGPAVTKRLEAHGGTVVLSFAIDSGTGAFSSPVVVEDQTSAPDQVVTCVIEAVEGLKLVPPDQHEGRVTLAWKFRVGAHKDDRPAQMDPPSGSLLQNRP